MVKKAMAQFPFSYFALPCIFGNPHALPDLVQQAHPICDVFG